MYQNTITVFNYHEKTGFWHPSVIKGADLIASKSSAAAKEGRNNADNVDIIIHCSADKAVTTTAGQKSYTGPMGVKEKSKQWQSLQYDMEVVSNKYHELLALKQQLETSGGAFVMGAETAQYAQMEASLAAANQRLAEMRAGLSQSEGFMSRLASGARSVFSWMGRAASTIGGAMLSGIKAAAKGLAKMVVNSKALKSPFDGLTRSLSRLAPALLMARGLMGILRKAVNAYMQENQQLASQLSACWSGIGNILGPIISRLISLVATAVAYVTQFLQLLGFVGKSTSKAIKSAGGGASKEADKLKRQLASFDELNILSDDSSDSGGGGGADDTTAELPEVEMPDWVQLMVDQFKSGQWAAAAQTLTTQLNNMVASVDWAGVGSNIAYWLDGALTFLATAITTFDWFNLGASLGTMVNNLIYGVDWGNLGIVLGAKFIALIEGLGGLFATIDWAALGKALADGIMGLWNAIDWVQAASTLSTGIIGALNALSSAIKNVDWQKLGNNIATFIANIDYSGIFTALSDGIGAAIGGIGAFLVGLLEDAWNGVVEWWYDVAYEDGGFTMEGLLQGIGDGICNIGLWIWTNICEPFINGIKEGFGIASPSTVMAEMGGFLIQGLLQGVNSGWESISTFFKDAISAVTNVFETQDWSNLGGNICSGIKAGIDSGWRWLKSSVTSLSSNLLSATKSALGIHSPSRLFRDQVGMNIGLGIGEGVDDSAPAVINSVTGVADAIAEEFNAGEYEAANIIPTTEVNGALSSFSDKISNSFTSLLDRLQAIAENVTFTTPAVATGKITPHEISTKGMEYHKDNAPLATIQEAVALVMDDYAATNLAGQEAILAVLKDILEAVLGIEIGDDVIGQAVARYNRKVAVMRGGA